MSQIIVNIPARLERHIAGKLSAGYPSEKSVIIEAIQFAQQQEKNEAGDGIHRRQVRMRGLLLSLLICATTHGHAADFIAVNHLGTLFTVIRVDLNKESLRLFWKDDKDQPLKSFTNINAWLRPKGEQLSFAMNAGMYHGNFTPVGLCVIDGIQLAPPNLQAGDGNFFLKPNGVFGINADGAFVIESSTVATVKAPLLLATQSGPMLVINGKLHPAFKDGSPNKLFRNGVGVESPKKVLFAISEAAVNFHDFATLFRDVLHCQNALFLDGTISSLHAPRLNRSDKKMDLGPIIGITVKD